MVESTAKSTVKPTLKGATKSAWLMTMILTSGVGWLVVGNDIGSTPSAQGQINVGGTSAPGTVSNDRSLSQQSLQEMQQNISTAGSGSMQMIRFGSQVSFPPLEGVQRILNWQVQSGANSAVTQDQQLSQAFHQFKQLQATQQPNTLSSSLVVSSQSSRNGDLLPALEILKKSNGLPTN
ncbi:MAG: hypothetical protein ACK5QS_17630 [Pseudanabaenaceae cyanobacterium]|jgi:hypothetical protein